MKFIECLAISCAALGVSAPGVAQETVRDPLADVMKLQLHAPGKSQNFTKVWVVLADIGGTPDREVFISHDSLQGDRGGRPWIVYTPVRNGYRRVQTIRAKAEDGRIVEYQGFASFRTDAFHIGTIEGGEGTELVNYKPSGGQHGALVGTRLEDGALAERTIRILQIGPTQPDREYYDLLFVEQRGELKQAGVEELSTEAQRLALIEASQESRTGFVAAPLGPSDPSQGVSIEGTSAVSQETPESAPATDPSVVAVGIARSDGNVPNPDSSLEGNKAGIRQLYLILGGTASAICLLAAVVWVLRRFLTRR